MVEGGKKKIILKGIKPKYKLLPLYKAVSLLNPVMGGGSTRPWLAMVKTPYGFDSYVLKLFSAQDTAQLPYLNKEVFASVIAEELDIQTPPPALIELDKNFISTLDDKQRERVCSLDRDIVFGCQFQDGYNEFGPAFNPNNFGFVHAQTIFAFDVFIRNFDRRRIKPNLLLTNNDYMCIDHDKSLEISKTFDEYIDLNGWEVFANEGDTGHLFHGHLRAERRKGKGVDFSEFQELLKTFNTRALEATVTCLNDHGIDTEDFYEIQNYLQEITGAKPKFFKLLNHLIG
ncbi:HipA family kinase [Pontibacter sp. H249]|uniref:HipA family kinase n=1 Tax=Pontibacter sp. H249 TaxID=3133420 RepID=UPI0030C4D4F7